MVDLTGPIAQPDARQLNPIERGQLIAITTQQRIDKIRADQEAPDHA